MSYVWAAALAVAGCASVAPGFYDAAPLDDPNFPRCAWSGRFKSPVIYQESDHIRGYFAAGNLAAYRQAVPARFETPARPLIRVTVLDFYEMVNGPVYLESEISVLALHKGQPGWFVLTMPVTDGDACGGGRDALGTPKVMRRITLERGATRYVGTSYARGGQVPEFTLTLDVGAADQPAREVLREVAAVPDLMLLRGRPVTLGGGRQPVYELESALPDIWKIRLGQARLDFPREPESLLHRLGVGPALAAYWGRVRYRFSLTPRYSDYPASTRAS
ncbi:MAG TPA: acetoacetate decarboxylase family protein [Methylomirabilota bacterium]